VARDAALIFFVSFTADENDRTAGPAH
jgi:hypothetical protein